MSVEMAKLPQPKRGPIPKAPNASHVRELLAKPGWSRARLAEELGYSEGSIKNWLSGNVLPPLVTVPACRWLLMGTEKASGQPEKTLIVTVAASDPKAKAALSAVLTSLVGVRHAVLGEHDFLGG